VCPISRQIKALKNFKPTKPGSVEHFRACSMLGKVFGTKTVKAAIQAQERNKVDVGAMEGVAGMLQDRIDEGTENLPTQGTVRPTPFDSSARSVSLTLKDGQKKCKNRRMPRA
jgi:hypothetical protein